MATDNLVKRIIIYGDGFAAIKEATNYPLTRKWLKKGIKSRDVDKKSYAITHDMRNGKYEDVEKHLQQHKYIVTYYTTDQYRHYYKAVRSG